MMSVKFVRPVLDPFQKKQVWITLLGPLVPGVIGAAGIIVTILFLKENPVSTFFFFIFSITYFIQLLYLLPFMGDGKSIMKQLLLWGMGGQRS
ncbi:hypothetical protein BsIDN1_16610 [Bacillus safensis]|uniref:Uncharacterized protein n=1 Tax=Bacillus safensis TaxID=561879 RepID=A0A5S9M4H7_BACIA|nr:hypothetical protein BsIDN1_16610 [Bacillus safensis]